MVFNVVQQTAVAFYLHLSVTKFADGGAFYLAAHLFGHGLHAVANAQHRYAEGEYNLGRAR